MTKPIEDRVAERIATVEYDSWQEQAAADSEDLSELIKECRKLRAQLAEWRQEWRAS